MPDQLGQAEDEQRHCEQREADRHHGPRDLARQDHHTDDQLGDSRKPDERRIAHAHTPEYVEERPVGEQGLRKWRIQELFSERAVRDPEAHGDAQQVDGGRRHLAVLERTIGIASRVKGDFPRSRDE
jgi:hypothetical protein